MSGPVTVADAATTGAGPAAVARTAPRRGRWLRLVPIEARLLLRRRTTLLGMLFAPALMAVFPLFVRPDSPEAWGMLAGIATLVGMLVSVYITASTVFTLRRESGVLSRLRTTELTGPGIVVATGTPMFAAGLVQTLLVYGLYLGLGAPFPQRPLLLLAVVLLGGAMCVTAGAMTSTLSSSTESVQFSAMPLLLAAAISANLLGTGVDGPLRAALLLVPGAQLSDVVSIAWAGSADLPVAGVPSSVIGVLLLAVWATIGALFAASRWRWTARG